MRQSGDPIQSAGTFREHIFRTTVSANDLVWARGQPREQFAAGLDATLPAELKSLAETERLDESMTKYDGLYRKLAACRDI